MEKYVAKCKNQSFMSKLNLWSSFGFLKFVFMSSVYYFLHIVFKDCKTLSWKTWTEFWLYEKSAL